MNSSAEMTSARSLLDWPRRADAWLDARGKWAWIAATATSFIVFYPAGFALLAWMIWGKKMFRFTSNRNSTDGFDALRSTSRPSGNVAFDAYRVETLRRLEQEQQDFESFMRRLREARDKQEFDRFMQERAEAFSADPAETSELPSLPGSARL